jgi:hypothetical protein
MQGICRHYSWPDPTSVLEDRVFRYEGTAVDTNAIADTDVVLDNGTSADTHIAADRVVLADRNVVSRLEPVAYGIPGVDDGVRTERAA